jgi:thymidylate synthase (FAD)
MRATCDRGVSHEMVRHRIASYSQESQRYCDYKKKGDLEYIAPVGFDKWSKRARQAWINGNAYSEETYFELREAGVAPQDARDVLTNAFTTHVILTLNWRSLRNMLRLRSAATAHPKYRQLAIPTLLFFKGHPSTEVLVHDIPFDEHFPEEEYAEVELTDQLFEVLK